MLNGSWQLWHGFGEWGDHRKGRMQKSTVARNGKTHFIAQQFPSSVHSQTTNGGRPKVRFCQVMGGAPSLSSAEAQLESWYVCKWSGSPNSFAQYQIVNNFQLSTKFKKWRFSCEIDPNKILGFHHLSSHLSLICTRCITSKRKPRMIKVPRWQNEDRMKTEWRQNEDRMKTEWRQNEEPSGTQLISLDGMKTAIAHLELAIPKRPAGYILTQSSNSCESVVNSYKFQGGGSWNW
jgi:hypothetical protein